MRPESSEVKRDENRKLRQYHLRRERDGIRMHEGCQSTTEKKIFREKSVLIKSKKKKRKSCRIEGKL